MNRGKRVGGIRVRVPSQGLLSKGVFALIRFEGVEAGKGVWLLFREIATWRKKRE
jgi:hypothetical protein